MGVRAEASVELEVAIICKRLLKEQVSLLVGPLRGGWWSWADGVEDGEAQSGGVHEEEGENTHFMLFLLQTLPGETRFVAKDSLLKDL